MKTKEAVGLIPISLSELDGVLERARLEKWRKLTIVGPGSSIVGPGSSQPASQDHTVHLRELLGDRLPKLLELTELSTLDLCGNRIGDVGARELSKLKGLTSLSLQDNWIGDAGARELAKLSELVNLDLSRNQIGDGGVTELLSLRNLKSLCLRVNSIGNLGAARIAKLVNLIRLDLSSSRVADAGVASLTALRRLTVLDLSNCWLSDVGAIQLAQLSELIALSLHNNQIGDSGTRPLGKLRKLKFLNLGDNLIGDAGAVALGKLQELTTLYLNENLISDAGAAALANLTALERLGLRDNQIGDAGVAKLAKLNRLSFLDLRDNQIGGVGGRALLEAWCDSPGFSSRQLLYLSGNEGLSEILPPEILSSGSAQYILAAYAGYRDATRLNELRPLNEAKLVVVGNEAVGKTSLIRYLIEGKPRNPDEKKTPGAEIHEKIEVGTWSVHQSQVRLNVWDFGGQEIMRGTHRFFLTERALYLLVLEARREDDRSIYEWLQIIAQRGGDSPVIVIINKSDDKAHQLQLDEVALRQAHPAIVVVARTSCNAGDIAAKSIAELRAQIATVLSESPRLQHVRDPIPRSWLRVKNAIAAKSRSGSVLPVRDFERLCEDEGAAATERVMERPQQLALLSLLHDLGVVVAHGLRPDAPAAWREISILDPNWLTRAIYTLIDNPTVRSQGGELHREQLKVLLDPKQYPEQWHELVLNMMQDPALGLCLPIAHGGTSRYLLPGALPERSPEYGGWPSDSLRFRFEYELLPSDFIPRLLVEAHRSLTENPTWWRYGLVLQAEGCQILVRADRTHNRVEIQVAGKPGQRRALSIVRNYFDAVHAHYAKLPVKAKVPLPEQPEIDVEYEHLLIVESEDGPDWSFRPPGAARKYTVRELLEGVREEASRPPPQRARPPASSAASWLSSSRVRPSTVRRPLDPDHGDRLALLSSILIATVVTGFVAWTLYAPWSRLMLLPPVFGVMLAVVWGVRKSAFNRRMAATLLGLASVSTAVPSLLIAIKGGGYQVDARISGSTTAVSVVCVLGVIAFGVLEYLNPRAQPLIGEMDLEEPERPDRRR